jgi:uncharacterized membrane protein YsdA (DUF1294 family)/cold shock CspA family protein
VLTFVESFNLFRWDAVDLGHIKIQLKPFGIDPLAPPARMRAGMPTVLESPLTAKIVEWDDQKGYGFLQLGKGKVFLHHRDFAERHKRPAVGDAIRFTLGQDAKGRTCAKDVVHVNDGGRITVLAVVLLACLLVLPTLALLRRGMDFRWVGAYLLVMGALSYWCYATDKRRARNKMWRISESGLHLTELLGGWPDAFLAQRRLRHKCSKSGYQFVFWLIVLAYQFAALDSLQNWQLSRAAWNYVGRATKRTEAAPSAQFVTSQVGSPSQKMQWNRCHSRDEQSTERFISSCPMRIAPEPQQVWDSPLLGS